MTRPTRKTIQQVLEHLQQLGLSVYGPGMDTNTGEEIGALMDYEVDDIIKRRKHIEKGALIKLKG